MIPQPTGVAYGEWHHRKVCLFAYQTPHLCLPAFEQAKRGVQSQVVLFGYGTVIS